MTVVSCVGLDHCKQFLVLDASSFVLLLSSFYLQYLLGNPKELD